ncbi:SpoIIE family protein phosphatase [Streptomyces eurythermus]|uniref:SpoIIE family protein phosphatase n=1 Tax=Streptomyces eurythermus TaxID=42237 RepID=UPI0033F59DEC
MLHGRCAGSGRPRHRTAVFGTLEPDPATGRVAVHLASGSRSPVFTVRADGTADFLPAPGGLLVGIPSSARFTAATTVLAPGDLFLSLCRRRHRGPYRRGPHRPVRGRGPARPRRRPYR